jgi:hypothetical protein
VTADDFATSVHRLLNQIRHWEQSRWSAPAAGSPAPSRADSVYALVQRLADLGADAEGRCARAVPRPGDLVLPDQLRVMSDDLIAARASDETLKLATAEVNELRHAL